MLVEDLSFFNGLFRSCALFQNQRNRVAFKDNIFHNCWHSLLILVHDKSTLSGKLSERWRYSNHNRLRQQLLKKKNCEKCRFPSITRYKKHTLQEREREKPDKVLTPLKQVLRKVVPFPGCSNCGSWVWLSTSSAFRCSISFCPLY